MLMWLLSISTSSHSDPSSFSTSESLEGEASGREMVVEEGEEERRDLKRGDEVRRSDLATCTTDSFPQKILSSGCRSKSNLK